MVLAHWGTLQRSLKSAPAPARSSYPYHPIGRDAARATLYPADAHGIALGVPPRRHISRTRTAFHFHCCTRRRRRSGRPEPCHAPPGHPIDQPAPRVARYPCLPTQPRYAACSAADPRRPTVAYAALGTARWFAVAPPRATRASYTHRLPPAASVRSTCSARRALPAYAHERALACPCRRRSAAPHRRVLFGLVRRKRARVLLL